MRVLVVGAGGLIGRALLRAAAPVGVDVVGLTRAQCDVTDAAAMHHALTTYRPDATIFCAGFTDVDGAAADPRSEAVNRWAPSAWARVTPTWLLSSNFVFGGAGPHAPGGAARPGSVYARQKVEAEADVLASGGHVVRVGWVFGPGGKTFASTVAGRLRRGERVRAIYDVVVQPTHSDDVATALLALPQGVTHLAGAGQTSWYGFAGAVRARVGAGTVEPVRMGELALGPRPRDARLTPARLPPWWARLPD
ncbi:MAG: NAD(P)-dependent oxidoreductase [Myxococcales bacterium]|nr:NAD(P)-dependent oxidoreductase [Myxococcales bacterium]